MTCKDCKKRIHLGDNSVWYDTDNSANCDSSVIHYHHPLIFSRQRTERDRQEGQQAGVGAGFDSPVTLAEASDVKTTAPNTDSKS